MSRILLIGYNPPPFQSHSKVEAAHYRTWQFIQPLLDNDHIVSFCVDRSSQRPSSSDVPQNLQWQPIPFEVVGWSRRLQAVHDAFQPDCVVAVNFYPSLYATKLHTPKPIWMDIYGDLLTVMQVGRYRAGSDQGIGTAIALMQHVLQRGDVFSVCSIPQQHALVGELAMCGRLNSRTFGYNFVHVVYPGAPPTPRNENDPVGRTVLRSHGIDPEAFVVLWCGGYNAWTDISTLYRALERTMNHDPRVHFVSVGASTYQATETMYDQFVNLVTESRHATRFHFLGWRPWSEIPDFYRESDVGINIDGLHYETIYGTRTRLVEMLAYGLPVITSEGCQLSYLIREEACGLGFSAGDWNGLAQHILQLAANPARLSAMRQRARTLTSQDLAFQTTASPLLNWVQAPELAPDNVTPGLSARIQAMRYRMRTVARMLLWRFGLSGHHV